MRTMEAVLAVVMLLGVLQLSSAVSFEVKDAQNNTCILAELAANFTVEYDVGDKKEKASFVLPSSAAVDVTRSTCGKENATGPLLAITFGNNNSLSFIFSKSSSKYQVEELVFAYNLSDKALFPSSSKNGTTSVSSKNSSISANTNSTYHCVNPHLIILASGVNITFHDVRMEAYLTNKGFSKAETPCSEDVSPTPAPTTAPTPTTPSPSQSPDTGKYTVNGTSGPCILANMGLKLHFNYTKKDQTVGAFEYNIEPVNVSVSGQCLNESATLILSTSTIYLLFNFLLNTSANQFYLGQVHVNTTILPDEKDLFNQTSGKLSFLQTNELKSYKCTTKQSLQITGNFSIDTYNLQVQAFNFAEKHFGPAIECAADQNGMLVPIAVGAALAGLVLIVLIAYLIGRKRSHAGYQTI